ncbi:MAG: aspartate-semialdehyde dehydrogenase [Acidobacteriota bacterium]|nr:MAG: aspartate-semialdehyde dehydrogenase [Acidobacteriota bacterium]
MRGYRVGVVNPGTPFGGRVRELLSEQHLPVIELKLFESEGDGETTLAQFHDEVVVTQPIDVDLFPHLDLLFFAGQDTDLMNRMAMEASGEDVLTFVQGALALDAPVMVPGLQDAQLASKRLVAVPRMASYLVGAVLERAHASLGVARASATVLLPAGERGAPGAAELHEQVINILSFKSPPTDILGEQVAFNVNIVGAGAKSAVLAQTVAMEAARLAELDSVTVNLVQVPVFHGYAASIWVELEDAAEQRAIVSAFREPPFTIETTRTAKTPSPVSVAESNRIHVGGIRRPLEVSQASRPGFWIWAVADTTAYDPALAAVELAKTALS